MEQVQEAAKSYARQCYKVLDPDKTTVLFNNEWLDKLTLKDMVSIASNFTVQQFLARDNYRKRIEAGNPVALHEFFYALLQGYDAVHIKCDVQIGAKEQLFNILAGRKLQEAYGQKPCVCITYPILVGLDGKMRMSKSIGNYIGVCEPPGDQYGKTMSISDETMIEFITYVTRWPKEKTEKYIHELQNNRLHPMAVKKELDFPSLFGILASHCSKSPKSFFLPVSRSGFPIFSVKGYSILPPLSDSCWFSAESLCIYAGNPYVFDVCYIGLCDLVCLCGSSICDQCNMISVRYSIEYCAPHTIRILSTADSQILYTEPVKNKIKLSIHKAAESIFYNSIFSFHWFQFFYHFTALCSRYSITGII